MIRAPLWAPKLHIHYCFSNLSSIIFCLMNSLNCIKTRPQLNNNSTVKQEFDQKAIEDNSFQDPIL